MKRILSVSRSMGSLLFISGLALAQPLILDSRVSPDRLFSNQLDYRSPDHQDLQAEYPRNPDETDDLEPIGQLYNHWEHAMALEVRGNYAFIADRYAGLRILDISEPEEPEEVAFIDTPGGANDCRLDGDRIYIADLWGGLRIIDVSDPLHPFETGSYSEPGFHAYRLDFSGSHVYVVDYNDGMHIIDISDPSIPVHTGYILIGGDPMDVVVRENIAYVTANRSGLRLIDVSDPSTPLFLNAYYTYYDHFNSVVLDWPFAYISDEGTG